LPWAGLNLTVNSNFAVSHSRFTAHLNFAMRNSLADGKKPLYNHKTPSYHFHAIFLTYIS
jgi:hypothetical protein